MKTLSDGGSFDEDDATDDDDDDLQKVNEICKIQSELQEVVEKIDQSIREGHENNATAIKNESETTIEPELPKSEGLGLEQTSVPQTSNAEQQFNLTDLPPPSSRHRQVKKPADFSNIGSTADVLGHFSLGKFESDF